MTTATAALTVPNLRQTSDFWDLSKRSLAAQRAGRYVPDSKNDDPSLKAGRTWPDVSGAIIDTSSERDDLIYAPMCGTGVELVEAVWRGRYAVGVELQIERLKKAVENLELCPVDPDHLNWATLCADARDVTNERWHQQIWQGGPRPSLVIIDPPFSETRSDGGPSRFNSLLHNYTGEDRIKGRTQRDPNNLGNLKHVDYLAEMFIVYGQCLKVAADVAYMAVIIKDYRKANQRIDLLGDTIRCCKDAGWRYYDRATLYLGTASHQQRRNAQANNHLLPITQDLLIFRKGR